MQKRIIVNDLISIPKERTFVSVHLQKNGGGGVDSRASGGGFFFHGRTVTIKRTPISSDGNRQIIHSFLPVSITELTESRGNNWV